MKTSSKSIIIAAFTILSFTSCVKQMDALPATVTASATASSTAEKFSDIKAAEDFKWSTSNKIELNFSGAAVNESQMVLKVQDVNGNILFQKLQKGNENFQDVIEIPGHCKTLLVSFGSTSKEFSCTSGTVSFTEN